MDEPVGPLRAARTARKWSQARAAREIAALADARGVPVAAPVSLKTQLSRWENRHALPEEHYRALLCELYESTAESLGLAEPTDAPSPAQHSTELLRSNLAAADAVDDEAVELLRAQLDSAHRLDRRLGAAAAEDSVRAQLSHLERTMAHALRSRTRRELAKLVADAAMLAGQHFLDRSRPSEAWNNFETARAAAGTAESAPLLGYAMAHQSTVLLELGEHRLAVEIVDEAARAVRRDAPGPLRAWFSARRGLALAAVGESGPAHSAYRLAERQLDESPRHIDIVYPELRFLTFDETDLLRHRGRAHLALREDTAAIEDLEQVLRSGTGSTRQLGGTHVDLAKALTAAGHPSEAAEHARSARDIAARIGSLRLAARLDAVATDPDPVGAR